MNSAASTAQSVLANANPRTIHQTAIESALRESQRQTAQQILISESLRRSVSPIQNYLDEEERRNNDPVRKALLNKL